MDVLNYTTLRKNLKAILDSVVDDQETVIINRGDDNAVLISLDQYNSWMETMHLLSTETNRQRLSDALIREEKSDYIQRDLKAD